MPIIISMMPSKTGADVGWSSKVEKLPASTGADGVEIPLVSCRPKP